MRPDTRLVGRLRRLPLWVRVYGAVAVVLAGMFLTTMLLGASGIDDRSGSGGGHGSGGPTDMEMNDDGSGHEPAGDHVSRRGGSAGDHGSGSGHGPDDPAE